MTGQQLAFKGQRGRSLIRMTKFDSELLDRFRRGDGDAATEFYTKYAQRLANLGETNIYEHLRTFARASGS